MNDTVERTCALVLLLGLVSILQACDSDHGQSEALTEVPADNFWQTTSPFSEGMDPDVIGDLELAVQQSRRLYSFLVIRNGKIVSESYRNGASQTTLLSLRSVTKHVTGLLAGMAVDRALLHSTEDYLAQYVDELPVGSAWEDVTLYHLLNMTSGMDWKEEDDLNAYESHLNDPLPYIFNLGIANTPGTVYEYNSPGTHLVSHLIQRVSGSTEQFALEQLFNPLGVTGYQWEVDGQGVVRGGAGLQLRPRDLAKIGLLYLKGGYWDGERLVPTQWVEQTLDNPIQMSEIGGFHRGGWGYRNYWWSDTLANVWVRYSDGFGGQLLLLAPDYDLIVVANHDYRVDAQANRRAFDRLLGTLLPLVLKSILN